MSPTSPTISLAAAPTLELPPDVDVGLAGEATPERFASGVELAPYRLVRRLGRGAYGEVWEAEDSRDQRRVALKLLTEDLGPRARERFRREGKIAASIHHPRVVFLFTAEELDGIPALAMELLPGGTLKDLVERRGPLPWKEAVTRIRELIDGLEAAQEQGILHRDVKPSNCFLDEQGGVKIGDFGLSRASEGGDSFTRSGTYVGTPSYSSPEQVRGAKLDARSDLYSLGATFYYLLSGQAPFGGENLGEVLARVLADPPRAIAEWGVELPRGLERVVGKLLAKDPDARYRDYDALRAALMPYTETGLRRGDILRRPVAFLVDLALVDLAGTLVVWLASRAGFSSYFQAYGRIGSPTPADHMLQVALELCYFFALELAFARSLGKVLLGLVVRKADGSPLDASAALRRAVCFVAFSTVPWELSEYVTLSKRILDPGASDLVMVLQFLLWLTAALLTRGLVATSMRRGNGYAGWHELLSNTLVLRAGALAARHSTAASAFPDALAPLASPPESTPLGPYRIRGALDLGDGVQLLLGTDPVLDRAVWILPASHASQPAERGLWRLQTLTADRRIWAVFAAPDGSPLLVSPRAAKRRPWQEARAILQGVAEIVALAGPGARFSLSSFWVTADLRVLRLPFAPPGQARGLGRPLPPPVAGPELLHLTLFWLADGSVPTAGELRPGSLPSRLLPKEDREIAETIAARRESEAATIAARLRTRLEAPGEVSRTARVRTLLLWAIPFLFLSLAAAVDLLVSGAPAAPSFAAGGVPALAAVALVPLLLVLLSAFPALPLSVLCSEGGLSFRLARLAVVRHDGRPAGPLRRLVRAVAAWCPALLALAQLRWVIELEEVAPRTTLDVGFAASGRYGLVCALSTSIFLLGAAYAALHPQRGLQDRIAGTALVPR